MPTARARAPRSRRRLLPLTVSIAIVAALLAFAGTAFAETKIGEGTSPEQPTVAGEADVLKAAASFDVDTGTATFEITTREAQESTPEEERPPVQYVGVLLTAQGACTLKGLEAEGKRAAEEGKEPSIFPVVEILSFNRQITAKETPPGVALAQAYGTVATSIESAGAPEFVPGTKSLSGTTATIGATLPAVAGHGSFNCAEVEAADYEEEGEAEPILFPLTTKVEPAPAQTVTPAPAPAAPAAPAPAALSIAKAKKPLKLKVGKWAAVKVSVANTGGITTALGSLQLKATKGVIVKGGKQKLPVLLPGGTWTVSYKVKLTAKAKKTSTLSLVGTAGTVTSKGSLVVKRAGG
jgi:hypothetical protein